MTIILAGQQSLYYHDLLRMIPICDLLNTKFKHISQEKNRKPSPLCSFCNLYDLYDEILFHMYYECHLVKPNKAGLFEGSFFLVGGSI